MRTNSLALLCFVFVVYDCERKGTMKQKKPAWMLWSVLTILIIMGSALNADALSEGETQFLCLSTGSPGVPGDGVMINSITGGPFDGQFIVQLPFPLAGVRSGITISAFLPSAIPPNNG